MKLNRLPRAGAWEVDVVPMEGIVVEDVELEGFLFVADAVERTVRHAEPIPRGLSLDKGMLKAAQAPAAPGRPQRPRIVRCRPHLSDRLASICRRLGARQEVVAELPAVDAAAHGFSEFSDTAPPIPHRPGLWEELLRKLQDAAPWGVLPDSVAFRFPGGGPILGPAVALCLGNAGEQRGIVVFPTERDYGRFFESAAGDPELLLQGEDWTCLCAHVDPARDLPGPTRRVMQRLGLVHEGWFLALFGMSPRGGRSLTEAEEVAVAAAVQGVLGLWAAMGEQLATGPGVHACPTLLGELTVVSVAPLEPEPWLADAPHRVALIGGGEADPTAAPALLLKMGKRDAQRLAKRLDGLDALSLEPSEVPGQLDVRAWFGEDCGGILTQVPETEMLREYWTRHRTGALAICGGGTERPKLGDGDLVKAFVVEHLRDEELGWEPPAEAAPAGPEATT